MRYYFMFFFMLLVDAGIALWLSWLFDMQFVIMFLLLGEMVRRINAINAYKARAELEAAIRSKLGGFSPDKEE